METFVELVEAWKTAQPWPRFVIWCLCDAIVVSVAPWVGDKVTGRRC